jgi:flagellar motor switch protein FliN/FliY
MSELTTDPQLMGLVSALPEAAAAAAAALGLPGEPQLGEPQVDVVDALGVPVSLAAGMPVAGSVSGTLVLLSALPLDGLLDDREVGGLTALSPRVRALRTAADALGLRYGDPVELDAADAYAAAAVTMSLDGEPVAALALRLPVPEHIEIPVADDLAIDLADGEELRATESATPAPERPEPGFRSSVPDGVVAGTGPVTTRLDQLTHVQMEVTVEIGRTRMSVGELLGLTPGHVVELDRTAGSPVDLFVNGTLLARGEVVVVDEDFGFRVTEIVSGQV